MVGRVVGPEVSGPGWGTNTLQRSGIGFRSGKTPKINMVKRGSGVKTSNGKKIP